MTLDRNYLEALLLYALFVLVALGVTLFLSRSVAPSSPQPRPLWIEHVRILTVASFAGLASFLLVQESIEAALEATRSIYLELALGASESPFYTLHQVLARVALVPPAIGLATLLSGDRGRCLRGKGSGLLALGYVAVLGGMSAFAAQRGRKSELVLAAVAGVLFYWKNHPTQRYVARALTAVVLLLGISMIDAWRHLPAQEVLNSMTWDDFEQGLLGPFRSNEAFGAHLSMYGALRFEIGYTYGASLVSLAASIIPRIVWPDRPADVYVHYASAVGAAEGQGYTIHHATGWYLNFGVAGILLGGAVLGGLWAFCHNRHVESAGRSTLGRMFSVIAPYTFVAGIPALIRGGPEAYKGMIIESFLLPTLVLGWACRGGASEAPQNAVAAVPGHRANREPPAVPGA